MNTELGALLMAAAVANSGNQSLDPWGPKPFFERRKIPTGPKPAQIPMYDPAMELRRRRKHRKKHGLKGGS